MPILNPNDPRLGGGGSFASPFPAIETEVNPMFEALMREISRTPGVPEGILAARQARAWTEATQVAMRARVTAPGAGGVRTDWLDSVASMRDDALSGLSIVQGVFARVGYPNDPEVERLREAAAAAGYELGLNVLSAVPVVGNILRAAVGFGRMIWGLMTRSREVQEVRVPWEAFSKDLDSSVINDAVVPLMQGTDWTPMFAPALDAEGSLPFELRKTDRGGETRAWGVFRPDGTPDYVGSLGMMPGMEQATQVIQIARTEYEGDATTDVGSFLPSFTQFGTGAWQQAMKGGNPDMFKVQAGDLEDRWRHYFERMFSDAWDRWNSWGDFDRLFAAKALAKYIRKAQPNRNHEDVDQYGGLTMDKIGRLEYKGRPFFGPDMFKPGFVDPVSPGSRYRRVDDMYILPALRRLKQRQKSILARTVVCALVRPRDVGALPAFAAFSDTSAPLSPGYSSFGEELTDYAEKMREKLLRHPARFELAQRVPSSIRSERYAPDVEAVDPPFAAKMRATFGDGMSLRATPKTPGRGLATPLEPTSKPPDPVMPPGGGPAFPAPLTQSTKGVWLSALAGVAMVGGGALAWHGRR